LKGRRGLGKKREKAWLGKGGEGSLAPRAWGGGKKFHSLKHRTDEHSRKKKKERRGGSLRKGKATQTVMGKGKKKKTLEKKKGFLGGGISER